MMTLWWQMRRFGVWREGEYVGRDIHFKHPTAHGHKVKRSGLMRYILWREFIWIFNHRSANLGGRHPVFDSIPVLSPAFVAQFSPDDFQLSHASLWIRSKKKSWDLTPPTIKSCGVVTRLIVMKRRNRLLKWKRVSFSFIETGAMSRWFSAELWI